MLQRSRPNRSASRTALSSSGAPTRIRHQFDASHPSSRSLSRFRQNATATYPLNYGRAGKYCEAMKITDRGQVGQLWLPWCVERERPEVPIRIEREPERRHEARQLRADDLIKEAVRVAL